MNFSATRLTLYAMISAIEADLRSVICAHLNSETDLTKLLGSTIFEKVYERLQKEEPGTESVSSVTEVVDYLDFADSYQILNANRTMLPKGTADMIQGVTPLLEALVPIRNRVAHSRPLNFEDFDVVLDTVEALQKYEPSEWKDLRNTAERIRINPSNVLTQIIPREPEDSINNNLPIPDFDETGFLGRRSQVDQLVKLILGPYPVISVIGEGGLGKTALALKVAYEFLDNIDSPFDAIVWTTAKSATITAHEIVKIENAISDSLGMLNEVAVELSGKASDDPIGEIIGYLTEFRILLILDNLETVIDKRIINFLERLPTGSKVVITSRIGLGEFERRLKLEPLDSKESVSMLRSLSRLRGLDALAKLPPEQLKGYCRRMKDNPGYIKWFVSAVQVGSRPEHILDQPGMFLDFCMSNVYKYLTEESKYALKAMQISPANLSQAELAVLTEMDILQLQSAIHQLLTTNMILMKSVGTSAQSETKYGLSELARAYLQKHHQVGTFEYKTFQKRLKDIGSAQQFIESEQDKNRFSIYSINAKSRGDIIISKYLIDALRCSQRHDTVNAQDYVSKARNLAPHNYEVHRVEAWVNAVSGNIPAAEESYQIAVELEPNSAPLRMLYGGFLMRYVHDNDRALEQYKAAHQLAPNEAHIKIELARINVFMHHYIDATNLLDGMGDPHTFPEWQKRKSYDLKLQLFSRQADSNMHDRDHLAALGHLERFVEVYKSSPISVRDAHVVGTLQRALSLSKRVAQFIVELEGRDRVNAVTEEIQQSLLELGFESGNSYRFGRLRGVIDRIVFGKDFVFVVAEDGNEYFMHYKQIKNFNTDSLPSVGDEVTFQVGHNNQGPCAVNCMLA